MKARGRNGRRVKIAVGSILMRAIDDSGKNVFGAGSNEAMREWPAFILQIPGS